MHQLVIKLRPLFYKVENKLGLNFKFLHNIFETVVINQEFYGVTIGQGCAGKCTFCAIKTAKGHIRSKPLDKIIDEFYQGIKQGHDKFWLLGDDIGCYGLDRGLTIVDLLKEILKIDYPFKLVINYFEPMFFVKHFDQIKDYLADPRIINMNIPIQSGSPRIVKEMGRDYLPDQVLSQLQELKKLNPNLVIKNNIIVGFPGETWHDLWLSIKSLFYFDANLAIPFAKRPGTRAAKMEHQVGEMNKKLRHSFMNLFVMARHLYIFIRSLKPTI
jgi:tRNA A37 methylthiotransferase MiaB